jgi:hypothetical protein
MFEEEKVNQILDIPESIMVIALISPDIRLTHRLWKREGYCWTGL